jgi:hypothetical protein
MKEQEPFIYIVRVNESVTIEVDPKNGAGEEQTAMTVDATELPSSGGTKPTYVFDDTNAPGEHFGILSCSFAGAPGGARFDVTLTGSVDGQTGFVVKKSDANHDPNLEFRVKNAEDYKKAKPVDV